MKKKTLLLLFLCAIPVAASREGGRQSLDGKAAAGISYLDLAVTTDFSDLDVRDAANRPIRTPQSKSDLVSLFHENLVFLTLFATMHPAAQTRATIDLLSYLFHVLFYHS